MSRLPDPLKIDPAVLAGEEPADDANDLHTVAANVSIGLAPTWQVEAAAEIEALASAKGVSLKHGGLPKQFRNGAPYREIIDEILRMNATGG